MREGRKLGTDCTSRGVGALILPGQHFTLVQSLSSEAFTSVLLVCVFSRFFTCFLFFLNTWKPPKLVSNTNRRANQQRCPGLW